MRRAIALFVTLMLIMIISLLVAKSLEVSQKSLEPINTLKNINQVKDIIKLTTGVLQKNLDFIDDDMMLELLFTTYPLSSEKVKLLIDIEPISNKIDINYAFKDYNRSLDYVEIFDEILDRYDIQNRALFYDIIYDTFDKDDSSKGGFDSEIVFYDKKFENGAIYDILQFNQMLSHYAFLANDPKIFEIPWKNIIYFDPIEDINNSTEENASTKKKIIGESDTETQKDVDSNESKKDKDKDKKDNDSKSNTPNTTQARALPPIYIDFMSDDLKLAFGISTNRREGEYIIDDDSLRDVVDVEFAKKFNLTYFKKGQSFLVLCKIDYSLDSISGKIRFIYDIGKKKVIRIEELL